MRRIVLMALSVILALAVAIPMAHGQSTPTEQKASQGQNLADLTATWWNWAFATSPSPLTGSYNESVPPGDIQCDGSNQSGVWFLSGAAFGEPGSVERTCTMPANTPILFPVFNVVCSEAFTGHQPEPDPQPYDTACVEPFTDATVDPPTKLYAYLDGKKLERQRLASGLFLWEIASDENPFGLDAGTYEAASDGVWVYLKKGLKPGEHTIEFGGRFKHTPFGDKHTPFGDFEGTPITYNLTVK